MVRFDHPLPLIGLERFSALLLETAASLKKPAMILTEQQFSGQNWGGERFVVILSGKFNAYLRALPTAEFGIFQTQLSFDPRSIAAFLDQLQGWATPDNQSLIDQAIAAQPGKASSKANDARLQSQLTPQLLSILADIFLTQNGDGAMEWKRQLEQERLLNQISTQILKNLELPLILQAAVDQVQAFLQVDRLLLFQFLPEPEATEIPHRCSEATSLLKLPGTVTYQSLATEQISPVLESDNPGWFDPELKFLQHYQLGKALAVNDVEIDYKNAPSVLKSLQQAQVQAKLVIPIMVQTQLWGLLIAHQCDRPRHWQLQEQTFLQQICQHLAIAIYQAQLSAQLQQQTQTLEQRVTERTQALEEALLSTQAAHRAKNDFLATMSHELRTPLTCVIGMSATLLHWPLGPLSEKQRSYLKTIHDSGEHLLELINDILDLSQVESGKAMLQIEEFSLSQLAGQSLQIFRDKAQTAGVELKAQLLIPETGDRFRADQRRLRQILINLLGNAIKFTPPGGKVTLRLRREAHSAIFQVEDTGIGIPSSLQPMLFRKFQQLDTSYRRSYEGVGLGLALTKQLVELHRGWIGVQSMEDKGSTFTVELPMQALPSQSSDPQAQGNGRIILIEALEESATLICDLLTAAGYQVVWMIDPSTAVQQIKLLQPLAVITALDLPTMEGFEIVRRLRQQPFAQDLKIVALTSSISATEQEQILEMGVDTFLYRPIDPEHLLSIDPEHLLYKVATILADSPTPAVI
jgi:two-component system, sensor histidine kinase and response regulator